ncbi:lysine transporter LysE [Cohnella pontilimi]|uniref:Lysine transporter LysE n=1 Tax=Cohnella pontilimi TaxID=2564100 RepID=A0A4V5LRM9_9BACL|nr:LysE family transporter [Cohnella pontilimi]TJY39879.1 lysine transporter LysE [Cohnella pontilimi]
MLYAFVKGFLFSMALCLDLGVVNIAIMKTGLDRGFGASFRIGFGSCFGDAFYMVLALVGWTAVFHYPGVRWVLWIGGTLVLLWLTRNMIRDTIRPKMLNGSGEAMKSRGGWSDILVGAGLAVSSPTLILSFAAIAGPVVADLDIRNGEVLAAFVIGFVLAGILWSVMIAWVGSRAARMGTGIIRSLSLLSAVLFLAFAINLFWDGLRDLVLSRS